MAEFKPGNVVQLISTGSGGPKMTVTRPGIACLKRKPGRAVTAEGASEPAPPPLRKLKEKPMTELDLNELSPLIMQRLRAGPDPKLTRERLVKILHLASAICLENPVPDNHPTRAYGS